MTEHYSSGASSLPTEPRSRKRLSSQNTPGRPNKINYPKKRVSVACEVCRARKTRCDARRPSCTFCEQLGISCIYRRSDNRTSVQLHARHAGDNSSGDNIAARLGRLGSLLRDKDTATVTSIPLLSPLQPEPVQCSPPLSFSIGGSSASPENLHGHRHQHDTGTSHLAVSSLVHVPGLESSPSPLFGYRLDSLSRLGPDAASLPELTALCSVDTDNELNTELFSPETATSRLFVSTSSLSSAESSGLLQGLDLSPRLCWYLEQSFSRDVLPWYPIIEARECADLVARVAASGFPTDQLETGVALFILALGSFARDNVPMRSAGTEGHNGDHHADDLPGIQYFHAGRQVVRQVDDHQGTTVRYSILRVQSDILVAFYLLFSLRPILAFEVLHAAGIKLLMLLQLRTKPRHLNVAVQGVSHHREDDTTDPVYHERLHRAYWTCYLLEHELQAHVSFSAKLLQERRDCVPLPLSNYDEPGMYWFLSEIALRGICSSIQATSDGVAWNEHMIDAPMLIDEVTLQLLEWHSNLAEPIRFPIDDPAVSLDITTQVALPPLLDPHKIFLRAQFYAVQATMHWPFVVQLLTEESRSNFSSDNISDSPSGTNVATYPRTIASAARSLQYAILHIYAVEPLLQDRHLMLFANIFGLFCITMQLLCAHGLPALATILYPGTEDAVRHALKLLRIWHAEPNALVLIRRVEQLMYDKNIPMDCV